MRAPQVPVARGYVFVVVASQVGIERVDREEEGVRGRGVRNETVAVTATVAKQRQATHSAAERYGQQQLATSQEGKQNSKHLAVLIRKCTCRQSVYLAVGRGAAPHRRRSSGGK